MLISRIASSRGLISFAGLLLSFAGVSTAQPWNSMISYPVPNAFSGLAGITRGPDGAVWFTEEDYATIGRITASGAITQFSSYPAYEPAAITTGPDGALWFAEEFGNLIGRITTSGVVTTYPLPCCFGVTGITSGPDGNIWFTIAYEDEIGKMTTAGDVTLYFSTATGGPTGIVAGPDGALWFTEPGTNSIGRITTRGVMTSYPLPGYCCASPQSIARGSDGALWFTEPGTNSIGSITTEGVVTQYPLPGVSGFVTLGGIASGPDGSLWVTEQTTNQLLQITTTGLITAYSIPTANAGAGPISTGPDGSVWFVEANANQVVSAAACGLGLNPILSGSTLDINFTVTSAVPTNWSAFLLVIPVEPPATSGLEHLFTVTLPPQTTPLSFTDQVEGVSGRGFVAVWSTLGSSQMGLLCSDIAFVNTGGNGPTEVELRSQIIQQGLLPAFAVQP
jgi:virginiamycin B lyase